MKKLLKHLSPFTPDISGAVSVLFELGGLTVICDAGGCTGNVCGFDEPRWFTRKSAIFSAGLRDMDAIIGRDDKLVAKLADAAALLHPAFIAVVGTPVPAVIATDYRALRRLAEKKTGLPCITVECTGTHYYDYGTSITFHELIRTFTKPSSTVPGTAIILGATPLDLGRTNATRECDMLRALGWKAVSCPGMGEGLDAYRNAASAEHAFVIAPDAIPAAIFLRDSFGVPFSVTAPALPAPLTERLHTLQASRILVIHQQFAANAVRNLLHNKQVDVASWFNILPEYSSPDDFRLTDEEDFATRVADGHYDAIIGDERLRHALPEYTGEWVDFPHFALSGTLMEAQ